MVARREERAARPPSSDRISALFREEVPPVPRLLPVSAAALAGLLALAGCAKNGDILESGVLTSYSACPPAAIPAPAGDITLFNPADSRDAVAIDVVATMTNVRGACAEAGDRLVTSVSFDVFAQRRDPRGPRDVTLPYFASVVQSGTNVVSKRVGQVSLHFADGQLRAQGAGAASSSVQRSAATLPPEIRRQITARRRAGDQNAALDPLSDPLVRAAVERARFELLVGFALTPEQLRYNATR